MERGSANAILGYLIMSQGNRSLSFILKEIKELSSQIHVSLRHKVISANSMADALTK